MRTLRGSVLYMCAMCVHADQPLYVHTPSHLPPIVSRLIRTTYTSSAIKYANWIRRRTAQYTRLCLMVYILYASDRAWRVQCDRSDACSIDVVQCAKNEKVLFTRDPGKRRAHYCIALYTKTWIRHQFEHNMVNHVRTLCGIAVDYIHIKFVSLEILQWIKSSLVAYLILFNTKITHHFFITYTLLSQIYMSL